MSGPNAALALPPDERPAAYRPEPEAPPQPDALTGALLETAAIGATLIAARAAFDDMEAARASGSLMLFRNGASQLASVLNATDLAPLSRHLAKTVGAAQPRSRRTGIDHART